MIVFLFFIFIYIPDDRVIYSQDWPRRGHLYLETIGSLAIITKFDVRGLSRKM